MTRLVVSEYTKLRNAVRQTLLLGQQKIEHEKVLTYWKTGKLINDYLKGRPLAESHADYGKAVISRLSSDLGLGELILYRVLRFAQIFPNLSARTSLSWSHYRALAGVPDKKKRLELVDRAERHEWNSRDLEREIKKLGIRWDGSGNGRRKKPPELLTPKKGSFYTYRLIRSEKIHAGKTDLRIDLGFSSYKEASMKSAGNFKAGEIAVSEWVAGDGYRLVKPAAAEALQPSQLFTYYAYLERIVDGDTILVQVDLGFGVWTRQYLRLRGIDCPELDTSLGRKAKRFVESELASVPYVVITSSRSDKYDRYLADLWVEETYINQELIDKGLAVRVTE